MEQFACIDLWMEHKSTYSVGQSIEPHWLLVLYQVSGATFSMMPSLHESVHTFQPKKTCCFTSTFRCTTMHLALSLSLSKPQWFSAGQLDNIC